MVKNQGDCPLISLVVPMYNEAQCVEELFRRSVSALSRLSRNFEIICVDDGSEDATAEMLLTCHERDRRLKVLRLSANYGHQAA